MECEQVGGFIQPISSYVKKVDGRRLAAAKDLYSARKLGLVEQPIAKQNRPREHNTRYGTWPEARPSPGTYYKLRHHHT